MRLFHCRVLVDADAAAAVVEVRGRRDDVVWLVD